MKTFFPTLLTVIVLTSGAALAFPQQQQDKPLFPVVDQGRTTYIDRTGKVVLTVPYPGSRFFDGLARVSVNFRHGYIDRRE